MSRSTKHSYIQRCLRATILSAAILGLAHQSAWAQQRPGQADPNAVNNNTNGALNTGPAANMQNAVQRVLQRKQRMQPWEKKLNWVLVERYDLIMADANRNAPGRAARYSLPNVPIDQAGRMMVELEVVNDQIYTQQLLNQYGATLYTKTNGVGYVIVWVPIQNLPLLAQRNDVKHILDIGMPYNDLGTFTTEGDGVHDADTARTERGLDGTGQHVGVISDGVDNLAAAQATADLGAVNVLDNSNGGDEGTAMLEIVADLAPGAALSFHTGHPGIATMVNAIQDLTAAGCTIITDDLPKPSESRLFETGPIEQAKIDAFNAGVFYTCSAGNRGNEHWQGNFDLQTGPSVMIGASSFGNAHAFDGNNDITLSATVTASSGDATFYLQWAEQFGSAGVDLDLYIFDAGGNLIGSSIAVQDGDDNPQEIASISVSQNDVVRVVVSLFNLPDTTVFFDLRAFSTGGWEYLIKPGSLNGASRQPEVYAAAAVNASNINNITSYSSRGPALQFFPAQTSILKPDGTTTDGVSVSGAGGFGSGTCPGAMDGDCLFFGTSASTPHVAGLSALLLEQVSTLTPAEVAAILNVTAIDIDAFGPDNNAGFGRLDIDGALDFIFPDCNLNGVNDDDEIFNDPSLDCNTNGVLDECDIDPTDPDENGQVSSDCQPNGIPDECELTNNDCNNNNIPDECDLASGFSQDCNNNVIPDECDIASGFSQDCNLNVVPDECELGNCLNQYFLGALATASDLNCEVCGGTAAVLADQFVVTSATNIHTFQWWGVYSGSPAIHDQFTIQIRLDAAGQPGALVVYQTGVFEPDLKLNADGFSYEFNYTPVAPAALGAGTYWVLIYNTTTSTTDWFWTNSHLDPVNGLPGSVLSIVGPSGPWNPQTKDLAVRLLCDTPDNDCNANGVPDDCEIAAGGDCNTNGILDVCETKPDGDPSVAVEQDECVDAMIVCPGFDYTGNNLTATTTPPFFCGLYYGQQDVFYRYRPAWDGTLFVRVEGPPIYWLYAIYDGCPNGMNEIKCNETDHFQIVINVEAGRDYYIRIASWGLNPPGSFEMNLVGPDCALNPIDLNGNMIPDICECLADVDHSGTVDLADAAIVASLQGMTCTCPADVNGDGVVDATDWMIVLLNQGACPFP